MDSVPTPCHFYTTCLRKLLNIMWQDRIPDTEVGTRISRVEANRCVSDDSTHEPSEYAASTLSSDGDRLTDAHTSTIRIYTQKDVTMTGMAPGSSAPPTPGDIGLVRGENRVLKAHLQQLQDDLQAEQDTVCSLRKRLNTAERERLDSLAKNSDEVSHLDSTVMRLRAQLERGEAVRQSHEFEMAKLNRQMAQERRQAAEREAVMADANDILRQKVVELSHQVEQLCKEIEAMKSSMTQEQAQLSDLLEMKEKALTNIQVEQDLLATEKEKLDVIVQQREHTITELGSKIQELEEKFGMIGKGVESEGKGDWEGRGGLRGEQRTRERGDWEESGDCGKGGLGGERGIEKGAKNKGERGLGGEWRVRERGIGRGEGD
ncbi:hypothetical protein LSAT2_000763 [Lamellibrachia satsuma]|nr:hypothetical protein LSAT2_000763 [Lamellibrachia satsuma]